MAQGQLRSLLSLIALISLIGGTFGTALGLIKIGDDPSGQYISEEEYIIPAAVGNTLCVIFLIWLTATIKTRSTGYKLLVIIFLIVGLIGEIYLTFFFTEAPSVYGTYILVTLNFLIRTFFVLEYVQDTWVPVSFADSTMASSKPISVGQIFGTLEKSESQRVPDDDRTKDAKKKLADAIAKIKADSRGIDGKAMNDAYDRLKGEIKSGKTVDEAYRSGKSLLKYKDGSPYTGAGRKRA